MAEPLSIHAPTATESDAFADRDTIALLQEEIARLEEELRLRDESAELHLASVAEASTGRREGDESLEQKIALLTRELSAREETIALLLEQIRLAEEAEEASRAEWEQLQRWIAEVERRVDDREKGRERDAPGADLHDALEAERRTSEALRQAVEKEQRSWQAERQTLVDEVDRLRGEISRFAGGSDATAKAVRVLEDENRQLRDAYHELARSGAPAHEVDALMTELRAARDERDAAVQELHRARDERLRERNEHEAAMNALRSQLARDSLRRQEEQVKADACLSRTPEGLLDADERIRAFREHLKEIHHGEKDQRLKRNLAARLSRLWHNTGPSR